MPFGICFFLQDVRIGCTDAHQLSVDLDENIISNILQQQQQQSSGSLLSSSPPLSGRISPPMPVTPSATQFLQQQQQVQQQSQQQMQQQQEPLELQIDYWPIVKPGDKDKSQTKGIDQGKNSIKSTFRNLQVIRSID